MNRQDLSLVKRILVKIGSNVLTGALGVKEEVIRQLSEDVAQVRGQGVDVIIVSSGAISSGLKKMGLVSRPKQLEQLQALASVGQGVLMGIYEKEFEKWGLKVGQLLITKEDLGSRKRYLNFVNTLFTLLYWGVVPIVNENDTVAVDEIKFGDNDNLSALLTIISESQLFINLTNTEGLFDRDPGREENARFISVVDKIDKTVMAYASKDRSLFGTGGMESKLQAARKVSMAGVPTVIANGNLPFVLTRILRGEDVGTFVVPGKKRLNKKKHWLAFGSHPRGFLVVDEGAEDAIITNGKSLLASGLISIEGHFERGDPVKIINSKGDVVGVGLVNYGAQELWGIIGKQTREIEEILGQKAEEVVHRDNMVVRYKL